MDLFSLEFIILLLGTFIVYYLLFVLNKAFKRVVVPQWPILLIASLIFYGFTNWIYLAFLGTSFLISYIFGLITQYRLFPNKNFHPEVVESHLDRRAYENIMTTISIVLNVGILATLKYFNFFSTSIASIFHFSPFTINFIIPLGISFYTFSLIAYNVDCNKRTTKAELNPFKFLLFVSYFPKVLQGPISSYDKLKEDGLFNEHRFSDIDYLKCFFRISVGLVKKIVIANVIGLYVDAVYTNLTDSYGLTLLLTSVLYAIQLYCDFSGFMDITIGVSGLFGIKLEENFNIPYISSSIQEFWRRWHITLGNWLKKYIYIPLGGNRVPLWRWILNVLTVWLISGIWHGANWTFVIWGLFHGVLLILTGLPRFLKKDKDDKKPNRIITILKIIGTFLLVDIGWILFRSDSLPQAFTFVSNMVQVLVPNKYNVFVDTSLSSVNWLFIVSIAMVIILIGIRLLIHYQEVILSKFKKPNIAKYIPMFLVTVVFVSFAIFVFFYTKSIGGNASSFIYFDF